MRPRPPTALSQNLKRGKPLGVDILGTRVVLFRDEETGEVGSTALLGSIHQHCHARALACLEVFDALLPMASMMLPPIPVPSLCQPPVTLSSHIPTHPAPQVSCLDDACPHRGAPLSAGWLAKDKSEKKPAAPAAGKRAGGGCGSKKKGSTCVVW